MKLVSPHLLVKSTALYVFLCDLYFTATRVLYCSLRLPLQLVSSTATCGFHCNLHSPLRLASSISICVFHCNLCLPLCLVSSTAILIFHWNLHLPLQHVSSTATCVFHCNSCFPLLPVPDRPFWNLVVLGYTGHTPQSATKENVILLLQEMII